jgi:hypothetical protein
VVEKQYRSSGDLDQMIPDRGLTCADFREAEPLWGLLLDVVTLGSSPIHEVDQLRCRAFNAGAVGA